MGNLWKTVLPWMVSAALLMPGVVPVGAQDEIQVLVDGKQIAFDQKPEMMNDRVMVPLRAVGEALGCEVHWYEPTQSIGLGRDGSSLDDVVLKVGYPRVLQLTLNNEVTQVTEIDQPPVVKNNRTLVPIRALSEAFGAEVAWNGETQTVTVTPHKNNAGLDFQDGVAVVKKGLAYGVQKEDGTMLLPLQYDGIQRYGNLLLASDISRVGHSSTVEFYDLAGKELLPSKVNPEILYAFGTLSVGWTEWEEKPGEDGSRPLHYTVFEQDGTVILDGVDEETYQAFKKERFPVNVVQTDLYGVEQSGLVKAAVLLEDGTQRYGYLNTDCTEVVIPCDLEETNGFFNGWASYRVGERWGYLDTTGKTIVQPQYEETGQFKGFLAPVKSGGLWGFLDQTGAVKVPPQYEEFFFSVNGLQELTVKKDGKWGMIDAQGNVMLPLAYEEPLFFTENLAPVREGGKYGYINRAGEWAIPAQFESCRAFSSGFVVVERYPLDENGENTVIEYALIDTSGKFVADFGKYSGFGWNGFVNGYISVGFPAIESSGILGVDGVEIECRQLIWP